MEHIAHDSTAEDGMRQAVADVAHVPKHYIGADEATEAADECGGKHTMDKE
ncbi:MAG: hypothetical protein NVS4B8_14870 [Herpetosiphon sp.]